MKKDVESCEFWLGIESHEGLKSSRSFIDRLTALSDLFIHKENRVVDRGNKKDDGKKKKKTTGEEEENFEFLNLSELQD